jgi:hypothetical protein
MSTSLMSGLSGGTDVWVGLVYQPPADVRNAYAWSECVIVNSSDSDICDLLKISYNNLVPHPDYYELACHEIGHTVGLGHHTATNASYSDPNKSCLRGPPPRWHWMSGHDVVHINGHY